MYSIESILSRSFLFIGLVFSTSVLASNIVTADQVTNISSQGIVKTGGVNNAWDMPPIEFDDLDGQSRNLHDWHGKVIILNFWATWCGPCQAEVPYLMKYQDRYGKDGLQVVGIGLDDLTKLKNFARTYNMNYPTLVVDPRLERKLLPTWGNYSRSLPFTVIIGRDGHMHYMLNGILDEEYFNDQVLPLIKDTVTPTSSI